MPEDVQQKQPLETQEQPGVNIDSTKQEMSVSGEEQLLQPRPNINAPSEIEPTYSGDKVEKSEGNKENISVEINTQTQLRRNGQKKVLLIGLILMIASLLLVAGRLLLGLI